MWIGEIFASFKHDGKTPELKDMLIMLLRCLLIVGDISFRMAVGILFGPLVFFWIK